MKTTNRGAKPLRQFALRAAGVGAAALAAAVFARADETAPAKWRIITLDPGHFHASLVQKFMYAEIDPLVHVYAPAGDDLNEHLKRIESFNTRADQPTHWREQVYTGADFLERMLADQAGNVVVIAGNDARKADYIARSIGAGLNVLADKPMIITPAEMPRLEAAFKLAAEKHVLLYDIMTERNEATTAILRELSMQPEFFGALVPGTPDDPAVVMDGVHFFSKLVAGVPLKRPAWFFDVQQQGEGIVDVTTHLVDLVQWESFPGQALSPADVHVLRARRWVTTLTRAQFKQATGEDDFPAALRGAVKDGVLGDYSNGEFTYTLRGVHCRVSVQWNFEPPPGTSDTFTSVLRGSKATLIIRQGAEQHYKPVLYVERAGEPALAAAVAAVQSKYPGVGYRREGDGWVVTVPAKYDVGHEAHFAQVTQNFLHYLDEGRLPAWEVPGMLTKYATLMQAYTLSHAK
jgi:predicted dehydrogenase